MKHLSALGICLLLSCTRESPPPVSKTDEASKKTKTEEPLQRPKEEVRKRIPANARKATVKSITDGDTVVTADGEKIRYIGIDTPERGRDGKPDEPFYKEASELNRALVEGKEVYLELDAEAKDKYKRTLAYVWILDGTQEKMANEEILRAGLAYVYTRPPNVKHAEDLLACQREARNQNRGLWKNYVLGGEDHYVATPRGNAYHRPSCKDMANRKDLRKFKNQGEALDVGLHPCRNCKP